MLSSKWIQGTYVDTDWYKGLRRLLRQDEKESVQAGQLKGCKFIYPGDFYGNYLSWSKEDLDQRLKEDRESRLRNGEGRVIQVGVKGYATLETVFIELNPNNLSKYFFENNLKIEFNKIFIEQKRNCSELYRILENVDSSTYFLKMVDGTVKELKNLAHWFMRQDLYKAEYVILTKSKAYLCTCKQKYINNRDENTNKDILVLPLKEFMYYGWSVL